MAPRCFTAPLWAGARRKPSGAFRQLHRARERVVCARTALINHMRGLLAEYGVILPQGAWRFTTQVTTAIEEAELSDLTAEIHGDAAGSCRYVPKCGRRPAATAAPQPAARAPASCRQGQRASLRR